MKPFSSQGLVLQLALTPWRQWEWCHTRGSESGPLSHGSSTIRTPLIQSTHERWWDEWTKPGVDPQPWSFPKFVFGRLTFRFLRKDPTLHISFISGHTFTAIAFYSSDKPRDHLDRLTYMDKSRCTRILCQVLVVQPLIDSEPLMRFHRYF